MKTYKEVQIVEKKLSGCLCDRCGRNLLEIGPRCEKQEALYIGFTGGYGSVFGDGTKVELDLCQHCFKELLGEYVRIGNDER